MSTKHVCVYRSVRYPEIKDEEGMPLMSTECIHCKTALPRWSDVHGDAKIYNQILQWTPLQLARHLHFWLTEIGETNNAHGLKNACRWENYFEANQNAVSTNLAFTQQALIDFENLLNPRPFLTEHDLSMIRPRLLLTEHDLSIILSYLSAKLPKHLAHPHALIYVANSLTLLCEFLPSSLSITNNEDLTDSVWRDLKFNQCHVMHLSTNVYIRILSKVKQKQNTYCYADYRLFYAPVFGFITLCVRDIVQNCDILSSDLVELVVDYARVEIVSTQNVKRKWEKV
jgi:hypothetical protein